MTGHKGEFCRDHCLPTSADNERLLDKFPTDICESVNSHSLVTGHTMHHMGKFLSQLFVQECADVRNLAPLLSQPCGRAAARGRRDSVGSGHGFWRCVVSVYLGLANFSANTFTTLDGFTPTFADCANHCSLHHCRCR